MLLCWNVWEKEKFWKELAEDSMSLSRWPHDGWDKHWFFLVEMDTSESPSKTELCMPNSWTKWIALRAASVSRTCIQEGKGIISTKVAKTSPWESQTTTPMPAAFRSSNTAPSKFVFTELAVGGFQANFCGPFGA